MPSSFHRCLRALLLPAVLLVPISVPAAPAATEPVAAELRIEQDNITEQGEAAAADSLQKRWERYQRSFDELLKRADHRCVSSLAEFR
ncbi:MAG TPA: hypothetical protein PKC26_14070, partial [Plasticicumulans sp.]|nr:hypothetical protein [Plasticicumulans sp.]